MIVDAGGIARQARLRFGEISAQEESMARERARMQVQARRPKTSLVLFRYSPGELFAVPLASVSRLERLEVDTVRSVGGRRCMAYQGGALALLYLDHYLPVQPLPQAGRHMYVILPRAGGAEAGLVASEVLDILETELDIRHYPGPQRGVVGLCEVAGRLTLLLDLEGLLEAFRQDEPTGAEASNRQPDQADPQPPPAEA
jgi:chemotaxis protein histidine kinase CheA